MRVENQSEQTIVSCNMVCIQAEDYPAAACCGPPPYPATQTQQQTVQKLCTHTASYAAAADLPCLGSGPFVGGLGPCMHQVSLAQQNCTVVVPEHQFTVLQVDQQHQH
jgi:hypothetical protein